MALPTPDLDDRRFPDLVEDATRLVRQRCPEWTDHNPSDPGATLLEAFAHLVDQLIGRLNQVPDRLQVKFLDLIGIQLIPPTPARAEVTLRLSAPADTLLTIPAGTEVSTTRTEIVEPVVFSTEQDLQVLPCTMLALRTRSAHDDESSDRTGAAGFTVFGTEPQLDDELLIGLDQAVPRCLVEVHFDGRIQGIGVDPRRPPLVWEAQTGDGWTACELVGDATGGLNTTGSVTLQVPPEHAVGVVAGTRAGWLRARVVEPAAGLPGYRSSPVLDDLAVCTVGVTGPAVHAEVIRHEVLGHTEGVPGQRFTLSRSPVLGGTVDVVIEVSAAPRTATETTTADGADRWQEWTRVEHFAESDPDDRHFTLDDTTGEVSFGPVVRWADGSVRYHGAVPARGAVVRVRQYAVGGGAGGNVAAGAIDTLTSSIPFVADVRNGRSAHGGVDQETLDEARVRGALTLRTRSRAVTAEDYEVLARQAVPELARVHCLGGDTTRLHPGTVTVLVVPSAAERDGRIDFADLVPSPRVLDRLVDHLDRVRMVGTRVLVEPPRYRGVTVVARLVARPRLRVDRVRDAALDALYGYLRPLHGGGPDGQGWPFGRAVRTGDLYAVLHRVAGVDVVEDVRLFAADPVAGTRGAAHDRIDLDANSLVFSFDHQVRVETS